MIQILIATIIASSPLKTSLSSRGPNIDEEEGVVFNFVDSLEVLLE